MLKPAFLTPGGHRRFDFNLLLQSFNMNNKAEFIVCYYRVSSQDQKQDLITQEQKILSFAKKLTNSSNQTIISISDLFSKLMSLF